MNLVKISFNREITVPAVICRLSCKKLIRDAKDQPILNDAIVANIDLILTGDKDFVYLDMEHPRCMTASQFLEMEGLA